MKTIYCRNYPAACDEAQRYDDERHAVTLQPMTCDCGEATVGFSVVCCDTGGEVLRIVGCQECCDRRRERTVTTFFTLSEPIRGIDFLFLSRRHGLHVRQRVWSHFSLTSRRYGATAARYISPSPDGLGGRGDAAVLYCGCGST